LQPISVKLLLLTIYTCFLFVLCHYTSIVFKFDVYINALINTIIIFLCYYFGINRLKLFEINPILKILKNKN
jgi:hypothetical protein